MRFKKTALLLTSIGVLANTPAHASLTTIDAGNYTFSFDEAYWGIPAGVIFTRTGDTFTFSQLEMQKDASGTRLGVSTGGTGFYNAEIIIQSKSNYNISSITTGITGSVLATRGSTDVAAAAAYVQSYTYWQSTAYTENSAFSLKGSWGDGAPNPSNVEGNDGYFDLSTSKSFGYGITSLNGSYNSVLTAIAIAPGSYAKATHDTSYFTVSVSPTAAVPEPETYAMLLSGLGLLAGVARRKQK